MITLASGRFVTFITLQLGRVAALLQVWTTITLALGRFVTFIALSITSLDHHYTFITLALGRFVTPLQGYTLH